MKSIMMKHGLIILIRGFSPLNTRCTISWRREKNQGSWIKNQHAAESRIQNQAQNPVQNQVLHQNQSNPQKKSNWIENDRSFLYHEKERYRISGSVLYGGKVSAKAQARAEIYENESKIDQSRKLKPSIPNDVHTNQRIFTTESLEETKQKEVQNEKWKRMFKTLQKPEPSYLEIISDADSRRNMRKSYPG